MLLEVDHTPLVKDLMRNLLIYANKKTDQL